MANAPSANDLRAAFKFSLFNPIVGKPSYETILKLETQSTHKSATVVIRLPSPHTNLSSIIEQSMVYMLREGAPFPWLSYPGKAAQPLMISNLF